jgi:hypothetical protein
MEGHWLTRPATIRKLWVIFGCVLAATVVAEVFVTHEAHFGIDGTFAFNAWYVFLACAALIAAAKALGLALKRRDRYYEEGE